MYSPEEKTQLRTEAALELMRFIALRELAKDPANPQYLFGVEEINEVLMVAGLPLIVPDEVNKKEVEVMI